MGLVKTLQSFWNLLSMGFSTVYHTIIYKHPFLLMAWDQSFGGWATSIFFLTFSNLLSMFFWTVNDTAKFNKHLFGHFRAQYWSLGMVGIGGAVQFYSTFWYLLSMGFPTRYDTIILNQYPFLVTFGQFLAKVGSGRYRSKNFWS